MKLFKFESACPACNHAYRYEVKESWGVQTYVLDTRFCEGGGWFRRCGDVPHLHIQCRKCKCEYLTQTVQTFESKQDGEISVTEEAK